MPGIFNIKEPPFNAAGDDDADDTDAINAAIAANDDADGGEVQFPPGIYRYDGTMPLDVRNTRFRGFGPSSVIRQMDPGAVTIHKTAYGQIKDLRILYNERGTGPDGLQPLTGGIGIQIDLSVGAAQLALVDNIQIDNAYIGIQGIAAGTCTLRNNVILDPTYAGIMSADGGTFKSLINNDTICSAPGLCTRAGLYLVGNVSGTVFRGGNFINCSGWGLLAVPNAAGTGAPTLLTFEATSFDHNEQGSLMVFCSGCMFNASWMAYEWVAGNTNMSDGLQLIQCARMTFTGASIKQNGGCGLNLLSDVTDSPWFEGTSTPNNSITVQACLLDANNSAAINVGRGTTDLSLVGNNVSYCNYGIYTNPDIDRVAIIGNMGTPTLEGGHLFGGVITGNGPVSGIPHARVQGNY